MPPSLQKQGDDYKMPTPQGRSSPDLPFIEERAVQRKFGWVITKSLEGTAAATAGNYGVIFTAPFACEVRIIQATWGVASTSGTLQLERLQSTTAAGSGDEILSSTIDLSRTANTVVTRKGIVDLTSARALEQGDRLALEDGGTLTNQNDLCVTVYIIPRNNGDYR